MLHTQDTTEMVQKSSSLLNAMKNHALNVIEAEAADWAISTYMMLATDFWPVTVEVYADRDWNFVYKLSDAAGMYTAETIDRAASVLAAVLS
jgi:hypothetical protein